MSTSCRLPLEPRAPRVRLPRLGAAPPAPPPARPFGQAATQLPRSEQGGCGCGRLPYRPPLAVKPGASGSPVGDRVSQQGGGRWGVGELKSPAFALGPAAKVGTCAARPCSARRLLAGWLGMSFVAFAKDIPSSVCVCEFVRVWAGTLPGRCCPLARVNFKCILIYVNK